MYEALTIGLCGLQSILADTPPVFQTEQYISYSHHFSTQECAPQIKRWTQKGYICVFIK